MLQTTAEIITKTTAKTTTATAAAKTTSIIKAFYGTFYPLQMKLPACKLISSISWFHLYEWQDIEDCCDGNELYPLLTKPLDTAQRFSS